MAHIDVWGKAIIKNTELRNRIVRSATNEHLADNDGIITAAYLDAYQKLARMEPGLIITSNMSVDKNQKVH